MYMYKWKTLVYNRDAANADLQAGRDRTALKLETSVVKYRRQFQVVCMNVLIVSEINRNWDSFVWAFSSIWQDKNNSSQIISHVRKSNPGLYPGLIPGVLVPSS